MDMRYCQADHLATRAASHSTFSSLGTDLSSRTFARNTHTRFTQNLRGLSIALRAPGAAASSSSSLPSAVVAVEA